MENREENIVGVIGGSGLYKMDEVADLKEVPTSTPFGPTSATPMVGLIGDTKVVFLPRHGREHTHLPSEINYRANIFAMKKLGVRWLLSVSAVGSLKEQIKPGEMVVVDQFIDRTKARPSSFFGNGIVGHVAFGDPICPEMFKSICAACEAAEVKFHRGGIYVCMEGPQYSTRAESNLYRSWGASIIGMTNLPEAKLACEAEIAYGTLAMSTDYDCWKEDEEVVTSDMVIQTLMQNVDKAKRVFREFVKRPPTTESPMHSVLKHAIVTHPEAISAAKKEELRVLFGKYL